MATMVGRCSMTEAEGAFNRDLKSAILSAATAADGALDGRKATLFCNDFIPSASSVDEDFTPPAWTGWAAADVTWTAVGPDGAGNYVVQSESIHWTAGANADQTVYGFAIMNDALDSVMLAARFDDPVAIGAGEPITLVIQVEM